MQELKQKEAELREQWESEKLGLGDIKNVRQEAEHVEHEFETLDGSAFSYFLTACLSVSPCSSRRKLGTMFVERRVHSTLLP